MADAIPTVEEIRLIRQISALAEAHCCATFDDGTVMCYTFRFPDLRKFAADAARTLADGVLGGEVKP